MGDNYRVRVPNAPGMGDNYRVRVPNAPRHWEVSDEGKVALVAGAGNLGIPGRDFSPWDLLPGR